MAADLAPQGGPFLLGTHALVLALSQALRARAGALRPLGALVDNPLVRGAAAGPQELVRRRVSSRLSPLAKAASLGYLAVARKP